MTLGPTGPFNKYTRRWDSFLGLKAAGTWSRPLTSI